jgi:hypothetical protein
MIVSSSLMWRLIMQKNMLFEFLGLPLKKLINEHHYPSISPADFTTQNCTEIRSHLYGVSNNDEKLKNQILRLLLKGHIEEFDEKNQCAIIGIKIQHKSEQYLAQLKIEQFKWSFLTLQYLGQAPKKPLVWFLSTVSILSLSFAVFLLFQYGDFLKEGAPDDFRNATAITEEDKVEVYKEDQVDVATKQISLEELKRMAEERQYVLITEDEHGQFLNKEEPITTEDKAQQESPKEVTLTIRPGMTSYDIAVLLEENRLARSTKEIDQLFIELRIQKKIRSGTFSFPSDATYMEIINGLTRNNQLNY